MRTVRELNHALVLMGQVGQSFRLNVGLPVRAKLTMMMDIRVVSSRS